MILKYACWLFCSRTEKHFIETYAGYTKTDKLLVAYIIQNSTASNYLTFNIERLRLTRMHAIWVFVNGRTLDNQINMNPWIRYAKICQLNRTTLTHMITSRNAVSPFRTIVVDFDNLLRDYLISDGWSPGNKGGMPASSSQQIMKSLEEACRCSSKSI